MKVDGQPPLQRRLAPGDRHAQHAHRQRGDGARRARPQGEPRRPRARGLPGAWTRRTSPRSTWSPAATATGMEIEEVPLRRSAARDPGKSSTRRNERTMSEQEHAEGLPRRLRGRRAQDATRSRRTPAWWCSTPSTRSRPSRSRRSPCAGTARPADAARAAPRSTASRSLMCMTRMTQFPEGEPITVTPMRSFPIIKDLVTDV